MEIKSILYGLVALTVLSSCQTSQRSPEPGPNTQNLPNSTPTVSSNGVEIKKAPAVGLILGPGGLKTYAHAGVLREFEKQRIPIVAVVGLEWGALAGGVYALKGKSFDVEWKLMKLKKESLPKSGLLNSRLEPENPNKLNDFLDDIFEKKSFENAQIKFACPTATEDGERLFWVKSGAFTEGIKKCLSFPPLLKSHDGYVAAPIELEASAQWLKQQGAEIVVFINALAQGALIKTDAGVSKESLILWRQIRESLKAQRAFVDWEIGIHTREYDMTNFEARRSFILFGTQSGRIGTQKLSEKFGY